MVIVNCDDGMKYIRKMKEKKWVIMIYYENFGSQSQSQI